MSNESHDGQQKQRDRASRRSGLLPDLDHNPGFLLQLPKGREGWLVARRVRVARRGLAVLAWTLPAMLIQALCLVSPGRAKVTFARLYWAIFARLIGIKVRVIGTPVKRVAGRPVIYVSNHSSWVDVAVVGGVLEGCFVAKNDVASWPVIRAEKKALAAEQQARAARRGAEQEVEHAHNMAAKLRSEAARAAARLQAAEEQANRAAPEAAEAQQALIEARRVHDCLPNLAVLRAAIEPARSALAVARCREAEARRIHDQLLREHEARLRRRAALSVERQDWSARAKGAAARVAELTDRRAVAAAEHAALQGLPAAIAVRGQVAIDALEVAESEHGRIAATLAAVVTEQDRAARAARAAETALTASREAALRAEAAVEQARSAWDLVAVRIRERLGANSPLPDPPADMSAQAEEKIRRRLDRLQTERENVGPVNLRAEIEAEEVARRMLAITAERDDLSSAIAKLRGSIRYLNREGRQRLETVFQEVDRHFQALFARMFGGGRAHLGIVGSDDLLEGGLEIYAQPPGKKLTTLSLLSGGEQALTALSLIFAVFRCNPAPICVLDEVDAPLDDVNVDRFCGLLEDMAREAGTTFLVVTHHYLTMARMDRLYGVTMQERGVSRLLSVDLQAAGELVGPPRIAAE